MSLAVIDAREWQNQFDLESGQKSDEKGPVVDLMKAVLAAHPYPGDIDESANQWVTQTAFDLVERYDPNLVCLSYVQQFFANRHFVHSQQEQAEMFSNAMAQAFRFSDTAGFTPLIIGTGDMIGLDDFMDLSDLDGLAISSNWSARYCGLHDPSDRDLELIRSLEGIERIVSKQEWIDLFRSVQPDLDMDQDADLMPDYLLVSKPGISFKTMGTTLRKPVTAPALNEKIPVYTPLGRIEELRQIKPLILDSLLTSKVALIFVEGVGARFFPEGTQMVANGVDWFCYEPGDAFYLTITTGKHQPFAYPAGYRYFDQDAENIHFPFSGYMTEIPQNTLAQEYAGRSIAVGNRSMFMHMVYGVDLSIECFARNLFNQGCLGVIHKQTKHAALQPA